MTMVPLSKRTQENSAGVTSKDRNSSGPRPDTGSGGGGGGELASENGWVPLGGIVMYSGAFADIPGTWALCDGTAGTPDLTDRFILGTNTEGDVGDVGGAKKHRHNLIAADTPGGTATVVAITGGTPAGTLDSVSAGTPAGTIDAHTTTPATPVGVVNAHTGPGTHTFTGTPLAGHTHTFTGTPLATHTHLLAGKTALGESEAGAYGADDTLPPFYKLAFIKRIR